jgi:hypothetical protein
MQSGFLDAILDKSRKILLASKSKAFIKFKLCNVEQTVSNGLLPATVVCNL